MEKQYNRELILLILIWPFLVCQRYGHADDFYKWVDENGKVVFSNTIPPNGAKILSNNTEQTTEQGKTALAVESYYKYSSFLQSEAERIRKGERQTKDRIEMYLTYLPDLEKIISDDSLKLRNTPQMQKLDDQASGLKEFSKEEDERGNTLDSFNAITQGQFCKAVSMKIFIEMTFEKKNIPYNKVDVDNDACFKKL